MASTMISEGAAFLLGPNVLNQNARSDLSRHGLGYEPDMMTDRVIENESAGGAFQAHPHSQSAVVDGASEVLCSDAHFDIAPHLDHGASCLETGVLFNTFSSAREKFLGEC